MWIEEVAIKREEGHLVQTVRERNDVLVRGTRAAELESDLSRANTQSLEQAPLFAPNVLVEEDQSAPTVSTTGFTPFDRSASGARRTASAMAWGLMRPPQLSLIASNANPSATCSNTESTKMRVPRNVIFPWQIPGSATMCRP